MRICEWNRGKWGEKERKKKEERGIDQFLFLWFPENSTCNIINLKIILFFISFEPSTQYVIFYEPDTKEIHYFEQSLFFLCCRWESTSKGMVGSLSQKSEIHLHCWWWEWEKMWLWSLALCRFSFSLTTWMELGEWGRGEGKGGEKGNEGGKGGRGGGGWRGWTHLALRYGSSKRSRTAGHPALWKLSGKKLF